MWIQHVKILHKCHMWIDKHDAWVDETEYAWFQKFHSALKSELSGIIVQGGKRELIK